MWCWQYGTVGHCNLRSVIQLLSSQQLRRICCPASFLLKKVFTPVLACNSKHIGGAVKRRHDILARQTLYKF